MINTQMLEYIIKLGVYSCAIENERPVSIILVAEPEHAKSEILKLFSETKEIFYTSDFNSFIFNDFAIQYLKGEKKIIMIPDFLKVVKKKSTTAGVSLMLFNSITEEGFTGKLTSGLNVDEIIRANLITAITPREMKDKRHKWAELGWLSRLLPVSYSYSEKTKGQIREHIKDRLYHNDKNYDFKLPEKPINVSLPRDFADKIEEISLKISEENNLTGFRLQKQLQTMSMSSAIINNRDMVLNSDIEMIEEISKFINFNFTKI